MKNELTKEQKASVEKIVRRLLSEVVKTMKQLPKGQFFGWKEEKYI